MTFMNKVTKRLTKTNTPRKRGRPKAITMKNLHEAYDEEHNYGKRHVTVSHTSWIDSVRNWSSRLSPSVTQFWISSHITKKKEERRRWYMIPFSLSPSKALIPLPSFASRSLQSPEASGKQHWCIASGERSRIRRCVVWTWSYDRRMMVSHVSWNVESEGSQEEGEIQSHCVHHHWNLNAAMSANRWQRH